MDEAALLELPLGCHLLGGNFKCADCVLAIEIHFFSCGGGVLIFLLRWHECRTVKLMCLEVELLLIMCPSVKIVCRVA